MYANYFFYTTETIIKLTDEVGCNTGHGYDDEDLLKKYQNVHVIFTTKKTAMKIVGRYFVFLEQLWQINKAHAIKKPTKTYRVSNYRVQQHGIWKQNQISLILLW